MPELNTTRGDLDMLLSDFAVPAQLKALPASYYHGFHIWAAIRAYRPYCTWRRSLFALAGVFSYSPTIAPELEVSAVEVAPVSYGLRTGRWAGDRGQDNARMPACLGTTLRQKPGGGIEPHFEDQVSFDQTGEHQTAWDT